MRRALNTPGTLVTGNPFFISTNNPQTTDSLSRCLSPELKTRFSWCPLPSSSFPQTHNWINSSPLLVTLIDPTFPNTRFTSKQISPVNILIQTYPWSDTHETHFALDINFRHDLSLVQLLRPRVNWTLHFKDLRQTWANSRFQANTEESTINLLENTKGGRGTAHHRISCKLEQGRHNKRSLKTQNKQ